MDALLQLNASLAGRYDVEREIGRGGMATVYVARDVRHHRRVAIKVLNPDLGAVLGGERFLSEIQVTANLQHPNLLPLFDSGEAEGLLFYVMPYVQGESLRARLRREKQLPIPEALHIATSVASALDHAHRHGVIHRDLKPENILLSDGQPLIADFGIALAVSNAGGNRITQTGLSLGTPQYMSPEQATGDRDVDRRTDVYALGAVLYEMLTGEPPHDGKTTQAIVAKVLTDRPRRIRLTRDTVPPHVETAVERALEKLPADRFASASDFAAALGRAGDPSFAAPLTATRDAFSTVRPRWRTALLLGVVGGVAAVAVAAWRTAVGDRAERGVLRYEIPRPDNTTIPLGLANPVAISSHGRSVAYVMQSSDSLQRLYLRDASELQGRPMPGSENAIGPFYSPDGQWIAFTVGGQPMKAPVSGGPAIVLSDVAALSGGTWLPSGWIVMAEGNHLVRIPSAGGPPERFGRPDSASGETYQANPANAGDGKTILYTSVRMGGPTFSRIGVVSMSDGTSTILDLRGTSPLGVLGKHLVYTTAAGNVMAAPFDLKKRRVTGAPFALGDQVAVSPMTSGTSYAQMSADGTLVYVSTVTRRQIAFVDADGSTRLAGTPEALSWPRLSPDGQQLAVSVGTTSRREVWLYALPNGPFRRLASAGSINDRPEWTPDGTSVIYRSNRRGRNEIWKQPVDGGTAVLLYADPAAQIDEAVLSPDGRYLVFQRDSTGNAEAWFVALQKDSMPHRLEPQSPVGKFAMRFSPDGKWVVLATGEGQVHARSFPDLKTRVQVTSDGGDEPVWSPDGRRIYYVRRGQLWAATLASHDPLNVASHSLVIAKGYTFNGVHADYDVMRNGRVVVLQSPTLEHQIVVVRNLAAEIKARSAAAPR